MKTETKQLKLNVEMEASCEKTSNREKLYKEEILKTNMNCKQNQSSISLSLIKRSMRPERN